MDSEACSKSKAKACALKSDILNGLNNRTIAIDGVRCLEVVRQYVTRIKEPIPALHVTLKMATEIDVFRM